MDGPICACHLQYSTAVRSGRNANSRLMRRSTAAHGLGSNLGSKVSATQEHSEALKPSKHGLSALIATRTRGLGAGRSQVQILSPRLREKQVVEPKTAACSSRKKGPPRGTISRTTCKAWRLPATLAGDQARGWMALLKSLALRSERLRPTGLVPSNGPLIWSFNGPRTRECQAACCWW